MRFLHERPPRDEINEVGMRFSPMQKSIVNWISQQGFCSGAQKAEPAEMQPWAVRGIHIAKEMKCRKLE